jgi:hypothetical protein
MKLILCWILLTGCTCCLAQEMQYHHAVSFGGGIRSGYTRAGNDAPLVGIFLDYDYMFRHSARGFWSAQAGASVFGFKDWYHGHSIRSTIGYNWGKKGKFFQLGLAGLYSNEFFEEMAGQGVGPHQSYYLGPLLGYKRIRSKGYCFRTSLAFTMPIVRYEEPPNPYTVSEYTGTLMMITVSFAFGWAFGK